MALVRMGGLAENLLFERSEFRFSRLFAYFFGNEKSKSLAGLRRLLGFVAILYHLP